MEQIIHQLIQSFDFAFILIVNVLTFIIIKILDELNGTKRVTTWNKRMCYLIVAIIASFTYIHLCNADARIIINSAIVAPITWSWLAKPIAGKFGIDYRKYNK